MIVYISTIPSHYCHSHSVKIRRGRVSTKAVGLRESSRNSVAIRQATPVDASTQGQWRGAPEPRSGHSVLVSVHRTDDRESDAAGEGRGRLHDTDGEEAKEKERKRANCRGQEIWENLVGGGKGRRGGGTRTPIGR